MSKRSSLLIVLIRLAGISPGLNSEIFGSEVIDNLIEAFTIYGYENFEENAYSNYNVKPLRIKWNCKRTSKRACWATWLVFTRCWRLKSGSSFGAYGAHVGTDPQNVSILNVKVTNFMVRVSTLVAQRQKPPLAGYVKCAISLKLSLTPTVSQPRLSLVLG